MTTVEQDLMQDTVMLQGPADDTEHKLVGHPFAVPDRVPGPADFVAFDDATAAQVRNHLIRKCSEAVTVSSMVAQMKGDEFDPESEELGVWFDNLCRKRKRVKASVSDLVAMHLRSAVNCLAYRPCAQISSLAASATGAANDLAATHVHCMQCSARSQSPLGS